MSMAPVAQQVEERPVEALRLRTLDELRQDHLYVRYGVSPQEWENLADETHFVELIDGKLIMHAPISLMHAGITNLIETILTSYVHRRRLGRVLTGPFVMDLGLHRKFEPDIMYLSARTATNLTEDRLVGAADLAIEIASPSTRAYDRQEKRECYRVGQVREYWMIDPYERRVTIDRPAGTQVEEITQGRVAAASCPGFWMEAGWLWSAPETDVNACLKLIVAD